MQFFLVHDNVSNEMVAAGIAEVVEEPMHMHKDGNIFSEKDAFGFKVTHETKYPEHFIMADEVGGNISQKGDGHIGGTRLLCEKGSVPKISLRAKTITLPC